MALFGVYWAKHRPPGAALAQSVDASVNRAPAQAVPSAAATIAPEWCQDIYAQVCSKKGETHDPTGGLQPDVDGELQGLRIYEEIIHQHPDWSSEQVDEELVQRIYTPKRKSRFEAAFRWVRKKLSDFIDRQPDSVFSAREKQKLKARVHHTTLQLPPPVSTYADEPDLFTKSEIYYQRLIDGTTRLRVGGAYILSAKSWFNIVFTMAHELGHSIDPCEVRQAGLAFPAYDRLMSCFLRQEIIAIRKTRSECGENDQQSEVFADWIAVQIASEALSLYATEFQASQLESAAVNSVRDLCDIDDSTQELDLGLHPSPKMRIDGIFGRNPKIRELLGCSTPAAEPIYCNFETTSGVN